jgi:hypothetical protein
MLALHETSALAVIEQEPSYVIPPLAVTVAEQVIDAAPGMMICAFASQVPDAVIDADAFCTS